jgi:integrase/recombinase XerD
VKIARCIEIFVERKRLCGYDYNSSAKILRRFAASVGSIDVSRITEKQIEAFLGQGQISHNLWRSYRSLIHRFLAYWFARRQISRVPEPKQKPAVPTRFFPYVYSRAEISRLLAAAPACQSTPKGQMTAATLRTIILFLYGTGLRVNEALSLRDSNIDFGQGLIDIQPGSFYLHRTIPMGTDVRRLLRVYLRDNERAPHKNCSSLFLTRTGRAVSYALLRPTFVRLREIACVSRPNSSLQPRLQDLRHTFAVHSMSRWAKEGWSYERMLPMLLSYMGNVRDKGFLRYLELTPMRFRRQLTSLNRKGFLR